MSWGSAGLEVHLWVGVSLAAAWGGAYDCSCPMEHKDRHLCTYIV